MTVHKAVIPAAGLGTRFLPATKAVPKEMLPVVDKPAIQYVIEEAVAAGIDDFLIVTAPSKRAIEDHFDRHPELEAILDSKGRSELRRTVVQLTEMADFHFTRQGRPLGLGHAVAMGQRFAGDDAFVVLLPDVIMRGPMVRALIDTELEAPVATVVAQGGGSAWGRLGFTEAQSPSGSTGNTTGSTPGSARSCSR